MRRAAWSTMPLLLLALAREAAAQPAPPPDAPAPKTPRVYQPSPRVSVFASLTYERKPGAEACPDEEMLRWALSARLGHDAFVPDPEGISVGDIRIVVTKSPRGFVARYEWTGSSDVQSPEGRRSGPGRTQRACYDVLADIATTLAIDFTGLEIEYGRKYAPKKPAPTGPAPEPAPAAAPAPPPCVESRFSVWPTEWPLPPLEKPKLKPPEPPERWPIAIRLGAAVWPEFVASGWGSLGLSVDAGVRYRAFSVGVEAHGDPPLGSVLVRNVGQVTFARLSGALSLCAHFGWFVGCGVGDAGRFLFQHHSPALPASTFYGAVGARAGLEFPVAPPRLFLRATVDLRAPINPASYTWKGNSVFASAGPSGGLGLGLVAELPP